MKKIAGLFTLSIILVACGSNLVETAAPSDSLLFPMELTYQGAPAIGDMANVQTVMEWNKRLSELNTDLGDLLADTVTWHLYDGTEMTSSRDSTLSVIKGLITNMDSVNLIYTAVVPIDVTPLDKGKDEWVVSWTNETYYLKNGKKEHHFIHEDYKLVGGLIREVFQYARMEAPPATAAR